MSNREQFLLDRKQGIGGSDVAGIMSLSPGWSSPLDVYNDKLNPIVVEEELSTDLKRGIRVEKYILQEYSENTNDHTAIISTLKSTNDLTETHQTLLKSYQAKCINKVAQFV